MRLTFPFWGNDPKQEKSATLLHSVANYRDVGVWNHEATIRFKQSSERVTLRKAKSDHIDGLMANICHSLLRFAYLFRRRHACSAPYLV
jgi:hypothetical protein